MGPIWELVLVIMTFGGPDVTVHTASWMRFGPYPTLAACLTAVDELNGAYAAPPRANEPILPRATLEWKARCIRVGAPLAPPPILL